MKIVFLRIAERRIVIRARRWCKLDISIAFSNVADLKSMSWAYRTYERIRIHLTTTSLSRNETVQKDINKCINKCSLQSCFSRLDTVLCWSLFLEGCISRWSIQSTRSTLQSDAFFTSNFIAMVVTTFSTNLNACTSSSQTYRLKNDIYWIFKIAQFRHVHFTPKWEECTLLWLSIRAWIFPSRMRAISSSSREATVVLNDDAIRRRSADK